MTWRVLLLVVLGTVLSGSVDAGGSEPVRARLVWADFDGDGLQDVYVVRPEGQDALFRNVGDGSFQDVTAQALPCVECASIEVAWRDVDLDRRPDLLRLLVSGSVELLRNRGNGVFEDATLAAGLERVTGVSAARWLDYDADGRADLELETESAPLVYHNRGDFLFESVAFDELGGAAADETSPVRVVPGALDKSKGGGSLPDAESAPIDDPATGSRRVDAGPTAVVGPLVAKIHPDPLVVGTPPFDPLAPEPGSDLLLPPFANRCALSVKDMNSGNCVLVSSMPTLGKLYPISPNLFVSTGGDVGIGTTSPAAKLDVAGTARVTDTLTLAPSGDTALDVSTGSVYKGGLLFLHTKGGFDNTGIGREALAGVTSGVDNTASGSLALRSNTTGSNNTASGYKALYSNTTGSGNTATGLFTLGSNTTGISNTGSGVRALYLNTTGNRNTANGYRALSANSTGTNNTASGVAALRYNTSGNVNTASGESALRSNTTGNGNTGSGVRALFANTTGDHNTASGYQALTSNTSGNRNTGSGVRALSSNTTGSESTANGFEALRSNTTGYRNTASGYRALYSNTVGFNNTASGESALRSNTTGTRNTASGESALRSNTTGTRGTAIGAQALYSNTNGGLNTACGSSALFSNTTGDFNTALGTSALSSNTTGSNNTASGISALGSNTTGLKNTAAGGSALLSNTSGFYNTASGESALRSNTIGTTNTASGMRALFSNTTGNRNTASGHRALFSNTIGSENTASGTSALFYNTTGSYNTASGYQALRVNTSGLNNTASGSRALVSNTTGNSNTAIGNGALGSSTTGNLNIALGHYAGSNLTTGNDNIAIGSPGVAGEAATIRIGTSGTHTRAFVAGIRVVTTGVADAIPVLVDSAGQLGTVSSSRRFKKDIADMGDATGRLLELRPVVFRYKQEQSVPGGGEVPVEYGLIAEEVAEIFPDLVVFDDEGLPFTVKYHLLSSMLLNELKKQTCEVDALHEQLGAQAAAHASELEKLGSRLAALESRDAHATPTAAIPAGIRQL